MGQESAFLLEHSSINIQTIEGTVSMCDPLSRHHSLLNENGTMYITMYSASVGGPNIEQVDYRTCVYRADSTSVEVE